MRSAILIALALLGAPAAAETITCNSDNFQPFIEIDRLGVTYWGTNYSARDSQSYRMRCVVDSDDHLITCHHYKSSGVETLTILTDFHPPIAINTFGPSEDNWIEDPTLTARFIVTCEGF